MTYIVIDDLRPLDNGELWILASYYDKQGGTRLSREQCHRYIVFAEVRNILVDGKWRCLDGRLIAPEDATAADNQIGYEVETVATDPVAQIKSACEAFLPALVKATTILEEFQKKTPQQLLAIAAGRKKYCQQMLTWAIAARDPDEISKYEEMAREAESAINDAAKLAAAAADELAIYVNTLANEPVEPLPQFTVDNSDPRGLLSVPEIAAMKGSGWDA